MLHNLKHERGQERQTPWRLLSAVFRTYQLRHFACIEMFNNDEELNVVPVSCTDGSYSDGFQAEFNHFISA